MSHAPNPGIFPVGSPQSRAAARALAESLISALDVVEMYSRHEDLERPEIGNWETLRPGSMTRRCRIPAGMTFDQALAIAGSPRAKTSGRHIRLNVDL